MATHRIRNKPLVDPILNHDDLQVESEDPFSATEQDSLIYTFATEDAPKFFSPINIQPMHDIQAENLPQFAEATYEPVTGNSLPFEILQWVEQSVADIQSPISVAIYHIKPRSAWSSYDSSSFLVLFYTSNYPAIVHSYLVTHSISDSLHVEDYPLNTTLS
ncbi:hypothetical protein BGZ76_000271 [Entomortierella beljakovae]|nr:hypothetical protein BGZ76_000271 [Entomortierella beljakovae]